MDNLPMPSDVRGGDTKAESPEQTLIEPPGVKLVARLFVIPFIIVALAIGVIYLISLMAGRAPTFEEALAGLKSSGGGRTADVLVGPGAKQRYLYAKTLTDQMKLGMSLAERVRITGQLIEILDRHTRPGEGEVQHFLLLALGRAWQIDPDNQQTDTSESVTARGQAVDALMRYQSSPDLNSRKAALLATVYFKGNDDSVARFLPVLTSVVRNEREDLDVRMSAATALGPLARPTDREAIEALHVAMRDTDPKNLELVWQSALSLAQLEQPEVADTILMLLSRDELAGVKVYDRETDPKNPSFRSLSGAEQERILINTMIGVEKYSVPAVQERLKQLSESDPSQRVRAALKARSPRDAVSETK